MLTVNYGAISPVRVTPDPGYHIADVLVDGVSVGAVSTSYTFTNVTANHTIAATFAIDTFTITASAGANGSISPSGAQVRGLRARMPPSRSRRVPATTSRTCSSTASRSAR